MLVVLREIKEINLISGKIDITDIPEFYQKITPYLSR